METPRDAFPTESAAQDDEAPLAADAAVEVRTLRAKNRILRAERTAIAGRKYVLETVVETLRQKLDELARAFQAIEAGGDVSEAIKAIGTIVVDARRIAEDKEALEGELDAERAERLQERRAREAAHFELEERAAALAAERSVLAERAQILEGKLAETQAQTTDVEDLRRQLGTATAELATAAAELERAANDAEHRAKDLATERAAREKAEREHENVARELEALQGAKSQLHVELDAARGESEAVSRAKDDHARTMEDERAKHARELEELQALVDQARAELAEEKAEREATSRALISAQAEHARSLEAALEHGGKSSENERHLREEMAATLEEERARTREALTTADAKRKALEAEKTGIEARLASRRQELEAHTKELTEARAKLAEQAPVLDALADRVDELEKEVNKLASRLGEARERGKVDVTELLVRAALLKRREAKAAIAAKSAAPPVTKAFQKPATGAARPRPAPNAAADVTRES
jgi:chromosome segregation ATPase